MCCAARGFATQWDVHFDQFSDLGQKMPIMVSSGLCVIDCHAEAVLQLPSSGLPITCPLAKMPPASVPGLA